MPPDPVEFDVDGETVDVYFGSGADLVVFPDVETEHVPDFTAWLGEQKPETDGGRKRWDGVCEMCGSAYETYMSHLQRCDGG